MDDYSNDPRLIFMTPEEIQEADRRNSTQTADFQEYEPVSDPLDRLFTEGEIRPSTSAAAIEAADSDEIGAGEAFLKSLGEGPVMRPFSRAMQRGLEPIMRIGADVLNVEREDETWMYETGLSERALDRDKMSDTAVVAAEAAEFVGDNIAIALATAAAVPRVVGTLASTARAGVLAGVDAVTAARSQSLIRRAASKYQAGTLVSRRGGTAFVSSPEGAVAGAKPGIRGLMDDALAEMTDSLVLRPDLVLGLELGSTATGGLVGGQLANVSDREDIESRFAGGSFVGAFISPTSIANTGSRLLGRRVGGVINSPLTSVKEFFKNLDVGDRAARRYAGQWLTAIALENDTTPEALIRQIDTALNNARQLDDVAEGLGEAASNLGVGQLTNSPLLVAMQRAASRTSAHSRRMDEEAMRRFLEPIVQFEDVARRTGNPADLALASSMRQRFFGDFISNRLEDARLAARNSFDALLPAGVAAGDSGAAGVARANASRDIHDTLETALKDVREAERALWSEVSVGVRVSPEELGNFAAKLEELQESAGAFDIITDAATRRAINKYLPDKLDEAVDIDAMIDGVVDEVDPDSLPSVDNLMFLRNKLYDLAGRARVSGDLNQSRAYTTLAASLKDDIDALDIPNIEIARDYSRQLNDQFTRGTVGRLLRTDRQGEYRVSPDRLLDMVIGAGSARAGATFRLDELMDSANFADVIRPAARAGDRAELRRITTEGNRVSEGTASYDDLVESVLGWDGDIGASVMSSVETYTRALVTQFTKSNGDVDYNRFSRWINSNSDLLDSLPESTRTQFRDAESTAAYFAQLDADKAIHMGDDIKRSITGGILGVENPTPVVRSMLDSPDRDRFIKRVASLSRQAERGTGVDTPIAGAMEGLRSSILHSIASKATTSNGINWTVYRDTLLAVPVNSREGADTLINSMVRNGVMDREQADRLVQLADIGARAQNSLKEGTLDIDHMMQFENNPVAEAIIGIAGSAAATAGARAAGIQGGAGSIVIPSLGARLARRLTTGDVAKRAHSLILEATSDAERFKQLLAPYADTDTAMAVWRNTLRNQQGSALYSLISGVQAELAADEENFNAVPEVWDYEVDGYDDDTYTNLLDDLETSGGNL